jgi:hypothetical protein
MNSGKGINDIGDYDTKINILYSPIYDGCKSTEGLEYVIIRAGQGDSPLAIHLGLCIPDTCTKEDMKII